jgi:outer membrane lipoprotein-sorting protein
MRLSKVLPVFFILLTLLICNRAVDCQVKSTTAKSIVRKMAAQYATASSYQDTGVVMDVKGEAASQSEIVIKFKTYFAHPHFFRFEWTARNIVTSEEQLSVIWNDGKQTFAYYSWDDPAVEEKEDIGSGVAGATGVSRGSAHTVPALLMKEISGFRLIEMSKLSVLGEERFEGEDCYVVRGYHPFNFPIDMWISKRDFLLRKTKEASDDGSHQIEIHRDVKLNVKVPRETFNFIPPTSKPKGRPKIGAYSKNRLLVKRHYTHPLA